MGEILVEYQFNDFESFIKETSFGGKLFDTFYNGYIFRGVSTEKYELIPSALRACNKEKLMKLGHCSGIGGQVQRIAAEYSILRQFYFSCDDANLYVPSCSIRKYPIDDVSAFISKETWPPEDLFEIAGLAQHYGLLTRLLDWSHDLFVALYFGCVGAMKTILKTKSTDDNIVLWALNAKKIEVDKSIGKVIPIKFIRPPYNGNINLGAQKGIFTLWEFVKYEQRTTDFVATPLDVFLARNANDDKALLYKLKLPNKYTLHLYLMLRKLGYNASRIFPGYQGVSQLIEEDQLYNQVYPIIFSENN